MTADFHTLEAAYITGQMSEAALYAHFRESPMFRRWFERREEGRRRPSSLVRRG